MAFVAQCPFCHLTLQRVPDNRLGTSVECPRCRNSFTLAPVANPVAVTTRGPATVPAKAPSPAAVVAAPASPPPSTSVGRGPAKPVPAAGPIEQGGAVAVPPPGEEAPAKRPVRRPPNYAGLASFLLGSCAFLAAAVLHLGLVTFALGLAGLLLGIVGVLFPPPKPSRPVLPVAGLAVSLPAVLVAALLPGLLGLSPLGGPPKPADREGEAAIALSGQGGFRRAAEGEPLWVDASRDALHHGDVRLRVSSATVGPASFEPAPGKKPPAERCLVIGLRVTNAGVVRKLSYAGWGGAEARDRPVLRDDQGKTYREKAFGPGWVVKGRATSASIPPGKWLDDVLVFEAPPATIDYLRLELPASAFGAEGKLQMEVPKHMIAFR
jgi:hypothetical protein